jgi:signal peptidase II
LFFLAAVSVFFLDQLIKIIVISNVDPARSIPFIKDILHFTYVQNRGVAFGLLQGQRPLLTITGIIICALIVYFYFQTANKDGFLQFSYAVILGGSLGNLYDRLQYGYVIDYIDFRFFPVFNLADIAINVGIFFIIIDVLFRRPECTR